MQTDAGTIIIAPLSEFNHSTLKLSSQATTTAMAPPQLEQAVEKIDEFLAQYPALTQYGMSLLTWIMVARIDYLLRA